MFRLTYVLPFLCAAAPVIAAEAPPPFPTDPQQVLERTCFQTGAAWGPMGNLRSDVAIVYGIDPGCPNASKPGATAATAFTS